MEIKQKIRIWSSILSIIVTVWCFSFELYILGGIFCTAGVLLWFWYMVSIFDQKYMEIKDIVKIIEDLRTNLIFMNKIEEKSVAQTEGYNQALNDLLTRIVEPPY